LNFAGWIKTGYQMSIELEVAAEEVASEYFAIRSSYPLVVLEFQASVFGSSDGGVDRDTGVETA